MWALFFIQIVMRGGDFVFPFLTLFLTRKLGLDGVSAGVWVMATVVSGVAGTLVAGKVSDHLGRTRVLLACMIGAGLLTGLCGLLPTSLLIPKVLVGASLFTGAMKPTLAALVMDLCPPDQRKEGFSLSYLGVNLGVAIGPMAAGLLFERHLPWTFGISSLSLAGAILLLLWMVPASGPRAPAGREPAGGSLRAFLGRPALVAYAVISIFVSFAYAQTGFGLTLYASDSFGARGAQVFGTLMSCNAVMVIASTTFLTRVTRRLPVPMVMALGTALYTVGFAMLALRLGLHLLLGSTLVWTAGEILLAINTGAFIAGHTPAHLRGRFQSICEALASTGRILSPLVYGAVIASVGIHRSWLLTALVTLACTVAFGVLAARSGRALNRAGASAPK